jgi:flagellar protein FliJ
MKSFLFNLQAALDLREREEQAARAALAESMQALRAAERELAWCRGERTQAGRTQARLEASGAPAEQLRHHHRYARYLWVRIGAAQEGVSGATRRSEERRIEWIEAERRRRALQRLRERQYLRYRREAVRDEDRQLDETVTARWRPPRAA